ncbi:hypothetical protein D3Y59_14485 [Hymenobacter oligotrophus]|uniref:Roadblock/LC7 domain-containing protein n=1 Tax=Hymenobacter oligotrophus TaxID=2319843 RepID=A0A3B7RBS7_9BACT|nr:hypothetical protein [Hymenobacter oligotrophus]AYA38139.1 hypothetical protein D3Y59_14485 [Hymenobacter oligotrophus]
MKLPLLDRIVRLAPLGAAAAPPDAAAAAVVQRLCEALPELLAAAVIELQTGRLLASHSQQRGLTLGRAAQHHAAIVRQKQQAVAALRLEGEQIADILISTREQLHLLRLLPGGQRLLYLAVSAHDTNLAVARSVLHDVTA